MGQQTPNEEGVQLNTLNFNVVSCRPIYGSPQARIAATLKGIQFTKASHCAFWADKQYCKLFQRLKCIALTIFQPDLEKLQ